MIYWYSGTGNSLYVAKKIALAIGDKLQCITTLSGYKNKHYCYRSVNNDDIEKASDNVVGFVFPVYSWGVPPLVLNFIDNMNSNLLSDKYIFVIMTCGDETARAPEMIIKRLRKKSILVDSIFSVIMPNNYVLLPGFGTDSRDLESEKVEKSSERIAYIVDKLKRKVKIIDVDRGKCQSFKTKLIYPLFKRWGINPSKWNVNSLCVGCGHCVTHCPVGNISMSENKPMWGDECVSCCACFHCCPTNAINYANMTVGKQQYQGGFEIAIKK